MSDVDLHDKVVIVTGAGRGIGRALAQGFGRESAKVVVVGRRLGTPDDPESLSHTAKLIADAGGAALPVQGAVWDMAAMQQVAYRAVRHFGGVDILVNNAGMYYAETFSDMTLEQWKETLDGYLTGAFVCSKVVVPLLIERGGGRIIHLGSNAANSTDAGAFAYGVIRGGMVRMTIKMAADLKQQKVAVNSYGPGFVRTERVVQVVGDGNPALSRARQPEDTVPEVLWLARQPLDYTGNVLYNNEFGKTWGPGVAAQEFKHDTAPQWQQGR